MDLATVVDARLAELGFPRWHLAAALGMSESSLSHRLSGRTAWKFGIAGKPGEIERLADALKMKVSDLIAASEAAADKDAA